MKKYKVIALSLGGGGKKIYNSGDIVTSSNFPHANVDELVKKGFLKEHDEESEKKENKLSADKGGKSDEGGEVGGDGTDVNNNGQIDIEETTKKSIMADLKAANIPFDSASSKEELYNIWINLPKDEGSK